MRKTPIIQFIMSLSLFVLLFSCEKIDLQSLLSNKEIEKEQDTKEDEDEDCDNSHFDTTWGYNCTFDLSTGTIIDSSSIQNTSTASPAENGSEEHPYSVSSFTHGKVYEELSSGAVKEIKNIWIHGYIVGYIQGKSISSSIFSTGNVATNIIIASKPGTEDYRLCVAIQLPSSSHINIREDLNLRDNPGNIGKHVMIYGSATLYMSSYGMKSVKSYKII